MAVADAPFRIAQLELDLDCFAGPFDLLLALVLREEVDLLEVELAEIVITFLDVLESRGDLDLEAATEFLVLIAALLELKSRLMLPDGLPEEFEELGPAEAAEELIERMLRYARYRAAGEHLTGVHEVEQGWMMRVAPLPATLRRVAEHTVTKAYDPDVLGQAIGSLLRTAPPLDLRHMAVPRVTVSERLAHLRELLGRAGGRIAFEDAVDGADRVTVAVTVWALLELYKQGEAQWEQAEPFGPVTVTAVSAAAAARAAPGAPAVAVRAPDHPNAPGRATA